MISIVLSVGCTDKMISEKAVLNTIDRVSRLLDSTQIQAILSLIPKIGPLALALVAIGLLLFSRSTFFRLHSAILLGALMAAILGIAGAAIGGFGAYASIYAVNNYYERWIGAQGAIVTALGGALVGVIGMIAAIIIVVLGYFVILGLVSALTGSTVDIPIVDRWGMSTGFSLRFWEPGDVGGEEGGFGCSIALAPGFLVAPIVGGYAAIRLAGGSPLDITRAPWTVTAICLLLTGFVGLLIGLRLGWVEGSGEGGGVLTGAFYGFLVATFTMDVLVLFYPTTFLRIVTYMLCITVFATIGSKLAPR